MSRMGGMLYIKAFTERFCFDILRISQILIVRQKQSSGNVSWDVIYINNINDIGVGLSTLLVSTDRAMREPLECGTGDRTAPRFLCMVLFTKKFGSNGVG